MDVFLIRRATDREQATRLAERLRWHDCTPTQIWATGDGVATAERLAAVIEADVAIETRAELDPSALPADAVVIIVADEPVLSALATALLATEVIPLAIAEALRISDGRLKWRFAWDAIAPVK